MLALVASVLVACIQEKSVDDDDDDPDARGGRGGEETGGQAGSVGEAGAGGDVGEAGAPSTGGPVNFTVGDPETVATGMVGPDGGTVEVDAPGEPLDGLVVEVPPGAVSEPTEISVATADIDDDASTLPPDTQAVSEMFVFETDPPVLFQRPVFVTLPYDVERASVNEMLMAYEVATEQVGNQAETRLEATSLSERNTTDGRLVFATRHFSSFTILEWVTTALEVLGEDAENPTLETGFDATTNGWFIANYGSIVNPGGNCIGMSSFAKWFFTWKGIVGDDTGLFEKYRLNDPERWQDDEVAIEAASRAQLGESAIWNESAAQMELITMSSVETAKSFAQAMHDTGQPQILYVSQKFADGTSGGAHAVLVTGFTGTGFTIYDPNHPGEMREVSYLFGGNWGIYNSGTDASSSNYHYNTFGHVGPSLFHLFADMLHIYQGAEDGFADGSIFPTVTLTNPTPESLDEDGVFEVSDESNFVLSGNITGGMENPATTLIFVNGTKFVTPIDRDNGGLFSQTIPLFCTNADADDDPSNDKENNNVVEFLVTEANEFSQYAGWERVEIDCDGNVPVARVTMSWNNGPTNDVDLWVTAPDMVAVGYSSSVHPGGAFLDFDDTEGYGPEHFIIPDGHSMPYGEYSVDVHYYDDASIPPDDPGEGPADYTITVEVGVIVDGVPYYETSQTVSGTLAATDDRHNGIATFELVDPSTVDKTLSPGAQDP